MLAGSGTRMPGDAVASSTSSTATAEAATTSLLLAPTPTAPTWRPAEPSTRNPHRAGQLGQT
eukprot:13816830-Alexandrium_andersonii.AAC.1